MPPSINSFMHPTQKSLPKYKTLGNSRINKNVRYQGVGKKRTLSSIVSQEAVSNRTQRRKVLEDQISVLKRGTDNRGLGKKVSELDALKQLEMKENHYSGIMHQYEHDFFKPQNDRVFLAAATLPPPRGKANTKARARRQKAIRTSALRGFLMGSLPTHKEGLPLFNHLLVAKDFKSLAFLAKFEMKFLTGVAQRLKAANKIKNEATYIRQNARFQKPDLDSQAVQSARRTLEDRHASPADVKKALEEPGALYDYGASTFTSKTAATRLLKYRSFLPSKALSHELIDHIAMEQPDELKTVVTHPGVDKQNLRPWIHEFISSGDNDSAKIIFSAKNITLSPGTLRACLDTATRNGNADVIKDLLIEQKYPFPADDETAFLALARKFPQFPQIATAFQEARVSIPHLSRQFRSPFKFSEFDTEL